MSLDTDVASLARAGPFGLLPREALRLIAFASERRDLKAGQTLFREGDPGDSAYLILDGEILLNAKDAERIAGRGALIGETSLLIDVARVATARVLHDASLLRVPRDAFRRVLGEYPGAAIKMRARALARTRALIDSLETLRTEKFAP
jgi:CRP-like cAMP-binding protein